ncbi:hypothetical protein [uncultured Tateyamaria sp.]|uniref:hypothetical protein n=1 Tax=uncultured Tateyamaria sp. TaxID=455651 RepID=UPI002631CEF8|nr:hypothetical protein [uncultured Tateyamaria sp.]
MKFMITAVSLLAMPAAAETFDAEQVDALVRGNTVYLDVPAGGPMGPGGEVPVYFNAQGEIFARFPTGTLASGTWAGSDAGYCADWVPAPKNSCSLIERDETGLFIVNPASGERRGAITRIVPGNPETFGG